MVASSYSLSDGSRRILVEAMALTPLTGMGATRRCLRAAMDGCRDTVRRLCRRSCDLSMISLDAYWGDAIGFRG